MITLYGIFSPYVFRVRAALEQKGLAYEHVSVNLRNRSEAFRVLTPVGKIPVLEDSDGTIVTDSLHIVAYLDRAYPDTYQMLPSDAREYARVGTATALADKIIAAQTPISYEKYGLRTSTPEEKDMARAEVTTLLARAKELLGDRQYYGDSFSHGDASMLSALGTWMYVGEGLGVMSDYHIGALQDSTIAKMFPAMDTKGVREI